MTDNSRYNFRETEEKWQKYWQDNQIFKSNFESEKPKYYVLEMFPYPSGNIHMGHVRNYTLGDVIARSKRAQGYNVLHPMGWDAFGLPAENAAIANNSHPKKWTISNIENMRKKLKSIGIAYDWTKELATCLPEYYEHEQLFFLKFLENNIAYRKESEVNWDPIDNTVLANEQVIDGRGWRSGALVERRKLSQWFLRISDFSEELLSSLDSLKEWPDKVRLMQERWIGKSSGARLKLNIKDSNLHSEKYIEIYTTRPETIFGMSFCAIAPSHPIATKLAENNQQIADFISECNSLGTSEEAIEKAEKRGIDTGLKIIHPFSEQEIPVYIANFVLMDYGSGAIFGCPAHDERDFEFATKYELPIIKVIDDNGVIINSDIINGLKVTEAKEKIISVLKEKDIGEEKINYRLRDWGISRQRYWGCPIPIIYCDDCGIVPVPEKNLPVTLPEDVSFDKTGNPLDNHPTWKHTKCPSCGKDARRETDTFDTFFESSWYYLRYATLPSENPLKNDTLDYWLPVDCYIGGIEHAVLHLLYSRFFTRALKKSALTTITEPFKRLETQGMICHETYKSAEGKWLSPDDIYKSDNGDFLEIGSNKPVTVGRIEKMSKSKKNTIDPNNIIQTYGVDAARLFMLSDSPPERDLEWTDAGIEGAWRYINRLWKIAHNHIQDKEKYLESLDDETDESYIKLKKATNKTIKAVTDDLDNFHFNKAIARIRELTNLIESIKVSAKNINAQDEAINSAIKLINPFLPHITEEIWQIFGNKDPLTNTSWPQVSSDWLIEDNVTIAIQINGKLRGTIDMAKDSDKETIQSEALALPVIQNFLQDKTVKKIIVVPNKIVSIVL
ncbi:MAG: leucine--tRNA ligase [Rickettsiales bacterium]